MTLSNGTNSTGDNHLFQDVATEIKGNLIMRKCGAVIAYYIYIYI